MASKNPTFDSDFNNEEAVTSVARTNCKKKNSQALCVYQPFPVSLKEKFFQISLIVEMKYKEF